MGAGILGSVWISEGQEVSLLVLCVSVITFAIAIWLARSRRLRRIPGMVSLRSLLSRAVEASSRVHLALGSGWIGGGSTVETTAALSVLDYLAKQSVLCDTPVTVSVGDPTTLAAAEGILLGYEEQREDTARQPTSAVHFVAAEPLAYASGAAVLNESEGPALTVALGTYGPEYLLIGESGARQGVAQVAGTTNLEALAMMHISADATLIGEEMFAVGAFLDRPQHLGSSLTEDTLRIITALLILVGVVLVSVRV
jgi:hypothetical protein